MHHDSRTESLLLITNKNVQGCTAYIEGYNTPRMVIFVIFVGYDK